MIYVDPVIGNDNNNGTSTDMAVRTISKARDIIRGICENMTSDIYVYLRGGTHTLTSTLNLTTADSGTNGYNVIYQAYPGETPVISGAVDITTGWTIYDYEKNIYKRTGINWNFRQLYVNDNRAIRARYPNVTNELTGEPYLRATNANYPYTVNLSDVGSWANNGTAEMVLLSHWKQLRGRILNYIGNTVYFKCPENGFGYDQCAHDNPPYFFENDLELLDAEGEWFLDIKNSTLYYKPRSGETMNITNITAPKVEKYIDISGISSTNKAHNIQFNYITLKYSNWLAPNSYGYVDVQAGYRIQTVSSGSTFLNRGTARYETVLAMVQLKYTSNIKLDHNTFMYAGAWGVMGNEGTDHTIIEWNTFYKNAGGGVAMGVCGDEFDSNDNLEYTYQEGQSLYDTIAYNTVDSVGLDYYDMVGIGAMLPQYITINNNEIKNLNYTGISIGWTWDDLDHGMTGNQISYNKIHDVMKLLDDGAGIYSLGRQTNSNYIFNNIYNITRSLYASVSPIAGIYFDNGSCYKIVDSNVLDNTVYAFYALNAPNHNNTFQNNFSNVGWGDTGINTLYDNTVVSGQNWPQSALDIRSAAGPCGVNSK